MKRSLLRLVLFLCLTPLFAFRPVLAQIDPGDPAFRIQIQEAIRHLRAEMAESSSFIDRFAAAKVAGDDSLGLGGITGRIDGITDADSAWVLAIAAHLTDDPTAWALGEVKPDGAYFITGLKAGTYIVMAGATGYMPLFYPRGYSIWEAEPVQVAPNEMRGGIDFYLEPLVTGHGALTGTVYGGPEGQPVAGANVYAVMRGNPFLSAWTTSNDDGTYAFENMRAGSYIVSAMADGFFLQYYDGVSRYEEATPVQVADGDVVTGIDFTLDPGGSISGRVVDLDSEPVAGAYIEAYLPGGIEPYPDPTGQHPDPTGQYSYATTDANGAYTITGLVSGNYLVNVHYYAPNYSLTEWYDDADTPEEATPVPVLLGQNTSGIDFEIGISSETGSLSGRVTTEDGAPVQEGWLRLESVDTPNYTYYGYAYPNADGRYVFHDVPVGVYRVVLEYWSSWFYNILWYDQATLPEDATPVEIVANVQVENIDFTLPNLDGVIEGVVTDLSGRPVANAYIQLSNSEIGPPYYRDAMLWAYAMTDASGAFRIENLPDGTYYASMFFCYFWECTEQWWPGVTDPAGAEPIVLTDGMSDPPSVDFTLLFDLGTASISGAVHNTDGEPLAGAQVTVMPRSHITPGGNSDVWSTQLYTTTDSEGAYAFPYLPAGTFIVHTSYWEAGGYAEQWYDGVTSPHEATPIVLGEGEQRAGIDFKLEVIPLYGGVSGRVFFEDGEAIARAYVEAVPFHRNYDAPIRMPDKHYAITHDDGSFTIENLYQGEYQLNVFAQNAEGVISDSAGYRAIFIKVAGGETTSVDVFMRRQEQEGPGEIAGRVTGEQGQILDIAIVRAIPTIDFGPAYYTAITDEAGDYRLTGLPEGQYYLQTQAPWHVTEYYDDTFDPSLAQLIDVAADQPVEGLDVALSPLYFLADGRQGDFAESGQGSVIFGTVTDENGNALGDATVYVLNQDGNVLLSGQTHADGRYEIAGVPPGASYRLMATHIGFKIRFNQNATEMDAAPTLTMNGGRYEVNFSLIATGRPTGSDGDPLPTQITLLGNYPNPFHNETTISLTIPESAHVTITVYDALGREIETLYQGLMPAGANSVRWNPSDASLSSGLYFYRIKDGQRNLSGKMILMR